MTTSKHDRISALPEHLRARLRDRLAGRAAPRADVIPPAPRDRPLPLSAGQQRLWFLNQFQPESTEYTSAVAFRLTGPLDVARLTDAVRGLVARHESLRTTFDQVDGLPVQVVHDHVDLALVAVVVLEAGVLFTTPIPRDTSVSGFGGVWV
ncbi:condensation domain-containing protein, partial [Actinosynnema sp. NPDC059335]|uniref:condensation domain-containing protein n=1 Tax=Actinosynnema sp. NPDC059335 TaxID=3346804 RepID=UPI00366F4C88